MTSSAAQSMARTMQKIRDAKATNYGKVSVSSQQRKSRKDEGIHGPIWVSPFILPAPKEDSIRTALLQVIHLYADHHDNIIVDSPEITDVKGEWVGHRSLGGTEECESENGKYSEMMKDVSISPTIIYVHGGAFYLFGPARPRPTAAKLSELTEGRCITVDYRLAPQNPFPAALLDLFVTYLSLLYPPAGSLHDPVPASSIILAGESAGLSLCLSFIQTILGLRNLQSTATPIVRFYGRDVAVPMPAGVSGVSGGADQALALPSWWSNAQYDWLSDDLPVNQAGFPKCELWPTDPPRAHIYCDTALLHHPLVSPTAARSWKGAPPMWLASGQERLTDSMMVIAQTAASQGCYVMWEQYEAMSHTWPMMFEKLPQTELCFRNWAAACRKLVSSRAGPIISSGMFIGIEKMQVSEVDVAHLTQLTVEEARRLMKEKGTQLKAQASRLHGNITTL